MGEVDSVGAASLPGRPFPLGADPTAEGTNFALASSVASGVELCLFDADGGETRVGLIEYDAGVWHGFVPGVGPGQRYGYRVHGPYDPGRGLRCNPAKLLLDPYARATVGPVRHAPAVYGYAGDPDVPSDEDSAPFVPRSLVVDPRYEWVTREPPRTSYADTVLYEAHVKGISMTHPQVPEPLRGTYAGLAHDAVVSHLVELGVTAVELLPVHQFVSEQFLLDRGLNNYWGYNSIGFLAPHDGYSAAVRAGHPGGQVAEFQAMVDTLHAAGLEVILDVVYNHSAEGNERGPTLCFRGIDNPGYYRLAPDDRRHYLDTTGTGNALNAASPMTLQLILDSLRYWLTEMRVDGFRFDLAPTLARPTGGFDRVSAFLDLVSQDPVVSQAKLIAEPWDVGAGDSYDLGRFPPLWAEWNGRYRDTVRDFWRSEPSQLGAFADRFTGSASLYEADRRRPTASVNFVTVHDGFTLLDLVSYDRKHNEANGEGNRDGSDDNRSWNCGVEGPTDEPAVLELRERQRRALLATLLLSFGVPLLQGGDEIGRTQRGNNNSYCQDNELTWFDWADVDEELRAFTAGLVHLRRRHPVFRRKRFLRGDEASEIRWFTPGGMPMTTAEWTDAEARALAVYLDGRDAPDRAPDGGELLDDDFLLLVNASWTPVDFHVPPLRPEQLWVAEIDTWALHPGAPRPLAGAGDVATVAPRSLVLYRSVLLP